jgi:hypothetical protein
MADFSSQTMRELQDQLNAAMTQANAQVAAAAAAPSPADFCAAYKTAKPLLQTAIQLLPIFLPGIGTTIAAALSALITVADKICPGT